MDVGAGECQFFQHLTERGWHGVYRPIDAVIDGTDLEGWAPSFDVHWIVCIETVEHLRFPWRLIDVMIRRAHHGVILTTPNAESVDVIACDPTHVSIVHAGDLTRAGFTVERHSWFGVPEDSLLAWRRA